MCVFITLYFQYRVSAVIYIFLCFLELVLLLVAKTVIEDLSRGPGFDTTFGLADNRPNR